MKQQLCRICQEPGCPGTGLRDYPTWDDLVAHNDFAQITRWVNELAERKQRQALSHSKYNKKQRAFTRVAKEVLGADEVAVIEARAKKEAEAKL